MRCASSPILLGAIFLLTLLSFVQEGQGIKCYLKEASSQDEMETECEPCTGGRFPGCTKQLPLGSPNSSSRKKCHCLKDNINECHKWGAEEHCFCKIDLCNDLTFGHNTFEDLDSKDNGGSGDKGSGSMTMAPTITKSLSSVRVILTPTILLTFALTFWTLV